MISNQIQREKIELERLYRSFDYYMQWPEGLTSETLQELKDRILIVERNIKTLEDEYKQWVGIK